MFETKQEMVNYGIWIEAAAAAINMLENGLDAIWSQSLQSSSINVTNNDPSIAYRPWLKVGSDFYLTRVLSSWSPGDICGFLKSSGYVLANDTVMAIRVSQEYYIPRHGLPSTQKQDALEDWLRGADLFHVLKVPQPPQELETNHITIEQYLYDSGSVETETPYRNGKINGVQKVYFENGNLKEETPYVDDNAHGLAKEYYESGVVACENPYVNGCNHGVEIFYNESGGIESKVPWVNGQRHGTEESYFPSGKLKTFVQWVNYNATVKNAFYESGALRQLTPYTVTVR